MSASERDTTIRKLIRGVCFLLLIGTVCYCQVTSTQISEGFWGAIGMAMTFYYAAEKDENAKAPE